MTAMAVCLLNAQLYGCGEVTYTNLQSLHEENAWGWTIERVVLSDTRPRWWISLSAPGRILGFW